jgi:hypothetical protein
MYQKWLIHLKNSSSPTAREISKIRKDLVKKVQITVEEFKAEASYSPVSLTSLPAFSPIYEGVLKLDHLL